MAWITQTDLENHIGAETLRRALDDNQDGAIDTGPLAELIDSACGFVSGAAGPAYPGLRAMTTIPAELKFLVLVTAAVFLCLKRPTVMQRDVAEELRMLKELLKELRSGERNAGNVTPDPPVTSTGAVFVRGTSVLDDQPKTFTRDGFGDF